MTSGLEIADNILGGLGCLEHGLQPLPCVCIAKPRIRPLSHCFMPTASD